MPANGATVQLSASGAVPQIEIAFGFAQWARYRMFSLDSSGSNPVLVGQGVNSDQIPDVFALGNSVAALNNRMVTWDAAIAPFGNSPTAMFSIMVRISQNGVVVPNGLIMDSGPLTQATVWHDMIRLAVV